MRTVHGPLTEAATDDWYADGVSDGAWVRASFITTLDGRATGPSGVSGDLNSGSEGHHGRPSHLVVWGEDLLVRTRLSD